MWTLTLLFLTIVCRHSLAESSSQYSSSELTEQRPLTTAPSDELRRDGDEEWRARAIAALWQERERMKRTPLVRLQPPGLPQLQLILKNESASVTGSLKHRYAWALVLWALLEGHIHRNSTVFEASSGNTATSEGYMLRLIGVPFVAIVPDTLEAYKEARIKQFGTQVIKTYIGKRIQRAQEEADRTGGFFMNQFANADKAEEFHESGNFSYESANLLHEVVVQLQMKGMKAPDIFVAAAGTGGTISSVGKYAKKYGLSTQVVLADTEFSVYYDRVINGRFTNESGANLWVEPGMAGFGFGTIGPVQRGRTSSLLPSVIDRALKVPDLASCAAMHFLREIGIDGGTSTGTNFIGALSVGTKKARDSAKPVVVATILADPGYCYDASYYNRTWIEEKFQPHGGLKIMDCWKSVIRESYFHGLDPLEVGPQRCPSPISHRG